MKFVPIAAGEFVRGSPDSEPGRQEREARRKVRIERAFHLGSYEVTQAEYRAVMETNPSRFGSAERRTKPEDAKRFAQHPVESVAWEDAVAFCRRLSERDEEKKAGRIYRLPTEAEWEFACRAGSQEIWCFGKDRETLPDYAWFRGRDSALVTHPVGEKLPNAWGLYDMHGNVWEWCADWYAEGETKVIRGGSYRSIPANTRSATRFHDPPRVADEDLGFRVVLEVKERGQETKR